MERCADSGSLGCLPFSLPLRLAIHALAGAQVVEVGLELGDHRQGLEEQSPERVLPVVDRGAQTEQHPAVGQVGEDLVGLGHVAGEPVELGDGEHAAVPHRG